MEMSKAATAPRQPAISARDRAHPLFPIYAQYRSSMSRNLVQADSFGEWLGQYERDTLNSRAAIHPRYPDFLTWMRVERAGARQCPAGCFPHNFNFWMEGGRW